MVGLSLVGKSGTIDFIRKNEPRGDKIRYEKIWDSSDQPDFSLVPTANLLYIVEAIEVIIEMKSGQTVPIISINDIKLFYPETQTVSAPTQVSVTIDTTNRGLDALIAMLRPDSIKTFDLSDFTSAKYLMGLISLNYILLDSSLGGTLKQLLFQAQQTPDPLVIAGSGRIILRAIGWKILRSEW